MKFARLLVRCRLALAERRIRTAYADLARIEAEARSEIATRRDAVVAASARLCDLRAEARQLDQRQAFESQFAAGGLASTLTRQGQS